jgi:hypothetical protein
VGAAAAAAKYLDAAAAVLGPAGAVSHHSNNVARGSPGVDSIS